jgi:hypothetical protein
MNVFNFRDEYFKSEKEGNKILVHFKNRGIRRITYNYFDRNTNRIKEKMAEFLKFIIELEKQIENYENYGQRKSFFGAPNEDFKLKLFEKVKYIEEKKREISELLDEYRFMLALHNTDNSSLYDDEDDDEVNDDRLEKLGNYYYEYLQTKIYHIDDDRVNKVLNWIYTLLSKKS